MTATSRLKGDRVKPRMTQRAVAMNIRTVLPDLVESIRFKPPVKDSPWMTISIPELLSMPRYGRRQDAINTWRRRASSPSLMTIWQQRKYLLPLIINPHEYVYFNIFSTFFFSFYKNDVYFGYSGAIKWRFLLLRYIIGYRTL